MPVLSRAAFALLAAPSALVTASFADFPTCHITATSNCAIADMGGKPTLVYPGGRTTCANGDAYAFVVYPGDQDKLAIHYGGGGACWEANGAVGKQVVTLCFKDLKNALGVFAMEAGLMDHANGPLKSYSMVAMPDCTGDIYVGDTTLDTPNEGTLQQRGYQNALAVYGWTLENLGRQKLSVLNLFGYSSGALGVLVWSGQILDNFQYTRAMVLMDSYASHFPPGVEAPTVTRGGGCKPETFGKYWQADCAAGTISVHTILKEHQLRFPKVMFANVQAKEDQSQIKFYEAFGKSWGLPDHMKLTGPQLYAATNDIFSRRMATGKNFKVFYIDGNAHLITPTPLLSLASAAGEKTPAPACSPTLLEWVTALINGRPVKSQCYGPLVKLPRPDTSAYCLFGEQPKMESMGCKQTDPMLGLGLGAASPVAAPSSTPLAILGVACVASAAAAGAVVYRRLVPARAAQTPCLSAESVETGVAE